jgi:SAM-dependent methyltransferase
MPLAAQEEEQERPLTDYDVLKTRYEEAYRAKDYDKAIEIGKEMNDLLEWKHAETLYNIGCAYAQQGNKGKAYEYLQKAVDAGYAWAGGIMKDEDLESLRGEPRFKEIVRAAWAKGYIWILERDERDEYQKPDEVMRKLAVKPGSVVADIGAGTGYFTIRLAKAVGPEGRVLAIDASQEMLDYLEKRIKAEQLENIELCKVGRDDPELPPGGVDMILMVDTFHYIKERTAYGEKLRTGLKPGGRLIVIDFIPKPWEERPWGPPPEQELSKETLSADLARAGFKVVKEHDFLTEQFFVVYETEY